MGLTDYWWTNDWDFNILKSHMKRMLIAFSLFMVLASKVFAGEWDIRKLTDNMTFDRTPQIDGNGNVAWLGYDSNYSLSEMFLYKWGDQSINRLGNGYSEIRSYGLSFNGNVAWSDSTGVFLYDGEMTKKISPARGNDVGVNSSRDVVWSASGLSWSDIYIYHEGKVLNLPNYADKTRNDYQVKISDSGKVVWKGDAIGKYRVTASNIFQYNYISGNYKMVGTYWGKYSGLSDINSQGQVVFVCGDEQNGYNIFLDDGFNIIKLTSTPYYGNQPEVKISGNNVVWVSGEKIFLYDGKQVLQIADNFQRGVSISGNLIVWEGQGADDSAVFLYDNGSVKELAYGTEPDVFGNAITWAGFDGNDWEIYKAMPRDLTVTPEPASMILFGVGGAAIAALRWRKKASA